MALMIKGAEPFATETIANPPRMPGSIPRTFILGPTLATLESATADVSAYKRKLSCKFKMMKNCRSYTHKHAHETPPK